jgi:hypothetical protein
MVKEGVVASFKVLPLVCCKGMKKKTLSEGTQVSLNIVRK